MSCPVGLKEGGTASCGGPCEAGSFFPSVAGVVDSQTRRRSDEVAKCVPSPLFSGNWNWSDLVPPARSIANENRQMLHPRTCGLRSTRSSISPVAAIGRTLTGFIVDSSAQQFCNHDVVQGSGEWRESRVRLGLGGSAMAKTSRPTHQGSLGILCGCRDDSAPFLCDEPPAELHSLNKKSHRARSTHDHVGIHRAQVPGRP